jgi:hypothetical protein
VVRKGPGRLRTARALALEDAVGLADRDSLPHCRLGNRERRETVVRDLAATMPDKLSRTSPASPQRSGTPCRSPAVTGETVRRRNHSGASGPRERRAVVSTLASPAVTGRRRCRMRTVAPQPMQARGLCPAAGE